MIELLNWSSLEINRGWVGREVEVLVEGPARRAGQVSGKTESFKTVVFEGTADTNSFVTVRVTDCTQKTLIGRAV